MYFAGSPRKWVITILYPFAIGSKTNLALLLVQSCVIIESHNFLLILLSLHGIYYPTDTVRCHGNGVQEGLAFTSFNYTECYIMQSYAYPASQVP